MREGSRSLFSRIKGCSDLGRPRKINSGERFGKLVVVSSQGRGPGKHAIYKCICDCGKTSFLKTGVLKKSKSCGCEQRNSKTWKRVGAINKPWMLPSGEAAFNSLLSRYKISAKRKGRDFLLEIETFRTLVLSDCYYCGQPPKMVSGLESYNGFFISNGVDRKSPLLGYTNENCVPCCTKCNFAKGSLDEKDFIEIVEKIYRNKFK